MNHYQVNLRSIACRAPRNPLEALAEFRDGPAPAVSPLRALAEGLPLIADLGVELLHIMPPFRMGREGRKGIGSPYAVADFRAIDREFGSLDEWFAMVRAAHGLGMHVILGFVPNHTARDHVWLKQDRAFHCRDHEGKAIFDFDWSDTAKLDYTHAPLRRAVTDVLLSWLAGAGDNSGVDGFRMDMAHLINDLGYWNEAIPELEAATGDRGLILLAECYGLERNLDLFRRGFHAAYDDDLYKIAQYGFVRDAQGHSRLLLDPAAESNGDFAPRLADWRRGGIAGAITGLIQAYSDFNRAEGYPHALARYTDNHDEGRGLYRFGAEASGVMLDMIACLPDTILFTLAGQEAGAMNRPPIHEYFGICDKGFRRERADGVEQVPGIEYEGNQFFRTSEARRQAVSDARKRFAMRREHPALSHGSWTPLDVGEEAEGPDRTLVAFTREADGERLHCLFNLGHEIREMRTPPAGTVVFGQNGGPVLAPFACRLVRA